MGINLMETLFEELVPFSVGFGYRVRKRSLHITGVLGKTLGQPTSANTEPYVLMDQTGKPWCEWAKVGA